MMRGTLLLVALVACSREPRDVPPTTRPATRPAPVAVADAAPAAVVVLPDASPASAACPAQEPTTPTACSGEALCTYGATDDCRAVYLCYAGTWQLAGRGTCGRKCPAPNKPPRARPNVRRPAGEDSVCVSAAGAICGYSFGERPCSGVPQPPRPMTWMCRTPSLCDFAQAGDACATEGQQCGGGCCSSGFRCVKGKWEQFFSQCPPSAR